uniref:Uncharacterized protein n=1 Tax=Arundo donax TaxID=35708 RepID=A0A0A9DN45_ARUDO
MVLMFKKMTESSLEFGLPFFPLGRMYFSCTFPSLFWGLVSNNSLYVFLKRSLKTLKMKPCQNVLRKALQV